MPKATWLSPSNYFKWKRYLLAKQLNTYPICMLRPPIYPSIRAMKYSLLPCWAINLSISPLSYCVWLWFPSIICAVPPLRQFQTVRGRRQPWIDLTTFIWSHCKGLLLCVNQTVHVLSESAAPVDLFQTSEEPVEHLSCATFYVNRVFLLSLGYSAYWALLLLLEHLSHLWLPLYSISFRSFLCPNQFPFGVSCLQECWPWQRERGRLTKRGWGRGRARGNSLCCHLNYYFGISSYI